MAWTRNQNGMLGKESPPCADTVDEIVTNLRLFLADKEMGGSTLVELRRR